MFSLLTGDTIVAVDSPFGRLGLTVCYDLRFPELYQILRFKHQAQVVMHSNIVYTSHIIGYMECLLTPLRKCKGLCISGPVIISLSSRCY